MNSLLVHYKVAHHFIRLLKILFFNSLLFYSFNSLIKTLFSIICLFLKTHDQLQRWKLE